MTYNRLYDSCKHVTRYSLKMYRICHNLTMIQDFPGGPLVGSLPANAGNTGSILAWNNSTCHAAAEPLCHSDGTWAPERTCHNDWSLCAPRPVLSKIRSPHRATRVATACCTREPVHSNEDPMQPKMTEKEWFNN